MATSKSPKNRKKNNRIKLQQAKKNGITPFIFESNGSASIENEQMCKTIGGVINSIDKWPFFNVHSRHSNNTKDENASLQNLIYQAISENDELQKNKIIPKYDQLLELVIKRIEQYNSQRKQTNMEPFLYDEVNLKNSINIILNKMNVNKNKADNDIKLVNDLNTSILEPSQKKQEATSKVKVKKEIERLEAVELKKKEDELMRVSKLKRNNEALRERERLNAEELRRNEELKMKEELRRKEELKMKEELKRKEELKNKLDMVQSLVAQRLDKNDRDIIELIEINTVNNTYTPINAKELATSDRFLTLLNKAMNDVTNEAKDILWNKITPKSTEPSHIKALAIQDIISKMNIQNSLMTASNKGIQKKMPIILGIPNGSDRNKPLLLQSSDPANLCGYLLDYVFSQEREGEEFILLAMYIAVNINNVCFEEYIKDKKGNCNVAFKYIAKLLKLSYNATTKCIEAFQTGLTNTYGLYIDTFQRIIKGDLIITDTFESKLTDLRNEVITRANLIKANEEKAKELKRNIPIQVADVAISKQVAKILQRKYDQRVVKLNNNPETFTNNPILKNISNAIINNNHVLDFNLLGEYIPLAHSTKYLSFLFNDLSLDELITERNKLQGELYNFFRNLAYLKSGPNLLRPEELEQHNVQDIYLKELLENITIDNVDTIEKRIKEIYKEYELLSEINEIMNLDGIQEEEEKQIKLNQIKLNILRQFNDNVFLTNPATYVYAKKILNKINLYRMILDIYIISKTNKKELINTNWGRRTHSYKKVAHLFYMVLLWFENMKDGISQGKTYELYPVEANAISIKREGQSFLNVSESKIIETSLRTTFTDKLMFLKNYNNLIIADAFTKYYKYLNDIFGKKHIFAKGAENEVIKAFKAIKLDKNYVIYNETTNKTTINLTVYTLDDTLKTSMTTYFDVLTKGYKDVNIPNINSLDNAIKYARYIDIIQILKSRKDYDVTGTFINDAIDEYINSGTKDTLNYIQNTELENDFVTKMREKRRV